MTAKKEAGNNSVQTVQKRHRKRHPRNPRETRKRTSSRRGAIYENLLAPERRSQFATASIGFHRASETEPRQYVLDTELVKETLEQSWGEIRKVEPDEANRLAALLTQQAARLPEEKLKWFRAAMLYRFIEEYEAGAGIHQSVLEFLYNVFTDVLQGLPFDLAICLRGGSSFREWTGVSRSQREKQEAAQFVSDVLWLGADEHMKKLFPDEPPEAVATRVAAKIFNKSMAWVRSARTEFDPRENRSKDRLTGKPLRENSRKSKKSGMTSQSS